tara:strand:+ start:663 stop:863 length:201 start_codon:yes stop_codon:yes gene_type:complete
MVTRSPYDVFTASSVETPTRSIRLTTADINQLLAALDNVTEPADGWSAHDHLRIRLSDLAIWMSID